MLRTAFAIALARPLAVGLILLGLVGCAHTPQAGTVAACIEQKLGPKGPTVVAEVLNDLGQQNWSELLIDLGPTVGWSALSCILQDVEANNTDPVKVARAKLFRRQNAAKLAS